MIWLSSRQPGSRLQPQRQPGEANKAAPPTPTPTPHLCMHQVGLVIMPPKHQVDACHRLGQAQVVGQAHVGQGNHQLHALCLQQVGRDA